MIDLKVRLLKPEAVLPAIQTEGASGMDLHACLTTPVVVLPGERAVIPTGIAIELPNGYEAQVRARSGLAAKNGIGLVNGIGTIDSDYRGELSVILINWGQEDFIVEPSMRIAQMIISKYERVEMKIVNELSESIRGENKFGSTGTGAQIS